MMDNDLSPEALARRWDAAVRSMAARYRGVSLEDLVQAGHEGVLEAHARYFESSEPPPKLPFEKAVWYYIRNAILREVGRHAPRLRRRRIDEARYRACRDQLEQYTANPTGRDVVGAMAELIGEVAAAGTIEYGVDVDLFPSPEPTPDTIADEEHARDRVHTAIGFLGGTERAVVEAHYFDDLPFEHVAKKLGLAPKSVWLAHKRALQRLTEALADRNTSDQRRVW